MITLDTCRQADAADPLACFREHFHIPEGLIYLDGNSLGAMPVRTPGHLDEVIRRQWGTDLIRSWNTHRWVDLPQRLGDRLAPLIGAGAGEVLVTDSTSVNLFKLLDLALQLRPGRRVILSDTGNFPTDLYMAQGLSRLLGPEYSLRLVEEDDIAAALSPDVAVMMVTQVNYRTGRLHDMARLTRLAREAGALALWDLSHSAGAVPVDLTCCDADLAVGCGYKYLNGGPGAPAFLFVARRHQGQGFPALCGWFGHQSPFEFELQYSPAGDIRRFLCGTPPILSMAGLEAGIELLEETDMSSVRNKSVELTDLFMRLIRQECPDRFRLVTPEIAAERGSQVSLAHPAGYAIVQALISDGVIPDFRAPDILRFGFTPLYTRYIDVWEAVRRLRDIMDSGRWRRPEFNIRHTVT
jgi:kynureninase